jgi:7,8-dihydropterin-6-yl-methyl-4-(beta-D-ribofuranosyl)aminobenzene 5'-phosphate synthase
MSRNTSIICLIENTVNKTGLVAEHGFSLYIETDSRKLLFDTGQSGLFIQNAKKLGIDIADVDILVLSHGHYDHTGGLNAFLEMNQKATVFAKKEIFTPKYGWVNRFIGTPADEAVIQRITFIDTIFELDEDIFIVPDIRIHHPVDTNFKMFYQKSGESFFPDDFADELFLVIRGKGKINIVTGCSHRGITNICSTAENYFKLPIHLIVGGFHMKDCGDEQYRHIVNYLRSIKPDITGACHCAGVEGYAGLRNDLDSKVLYISTGDEINLAAL